MGLSEKIIAFLDANPRSSASRITAAVGAKHTSVNVRLRKLREENLVRIGDWDGLIVGLYELGSAADAVCPKLQMLYDIKYFIRDHPGCTISEVNESFPMDPEKLSGMLISMRKRKMIYIGGWKNGSSGMYYVGALLDFPKSAGRPSKEDKERLAEATVQHARATLTQGLWGQLIR